MPSTRRPLPERFGLPALFLTLAAGCAAYPTAARTEVASRSSVVVGPTASVGPANPAASDESGAATEEGLHIDELDSELAEDDSEDETELSPGQRALAPIGPHPLEGWSRERIAEALQRDPASLGSLSIGQPSAGALLGGVQAEPSELFEPVAPYGAFGTLETLEYLRAAVRHVHAQFPNTPPLFLGHISDRDGGPLSPHLSHQSGRDVDISFYYATRARWYARATRENLDLPRTWSFVRALVTETDVEMILIDHSILALLRSHALEIGEDAGWIESLFRGEAGALRPIFRHVPGHATHIHIRFYNPIAQESARRCHDVLVESGKARALQAFVKHRARRGDTLGKLAKKYGVSVEAIKAANGLRKSLIRERREYRIPVRAPVPRPSRAPLAFPARRLPPGAGAPTPVTATY